MFNNHLPFNHLRAFNYLRACKAPNKAGKAYNLRFEISNLKLLTPMSAESQRAKQQPTKEYVRNYEQIMQNKPNFPETQMSVNKVLTMNYEKKDTWWTGKKRTQTNPNKPNFVGAKMSVTLVLIKDCENICPCRAPKNKPNSNPIRQEPKMSASSLLTRDYGNNHMPPLPENKPNQTQSQKQPSDLP